MTSPEETRVEREAAGSGGLAGTSAARLVDIPSFQDGRGVLTFAQEGDHIPFAPRRYYTLAGVPMGKIRGGHAHAAYHTFIVALCGSCLATYDDGTSRRSVTLDRPTIGLYLPPLHWRELSGFTPDGLVLCISSGLYDPAEYIHDYGMFIRAVRGQ